MKHFRLSPEQIGRLDRWWIAHVYFARRDKFGVLEVRPKGTATAALGEWERMLEWGKSWGLPEWYTRRRFDRIKEERTAAAKRKTR